ncbi:MAG: heme-binding protein [Burkholderiales bacterium]|nr:heme-binding protein [Burkholderiales bacterium]
MKSELRSKLILTLSVAQKIAAAAEAEAKKNGWDVSIAVMDDAARLICFLHMDNANNASSDIAIAKARHAINYRRDTKFHEDVVAAGHNQVLAFPNVLPVEGGIRLIVDDVVIGAIGVSGVQSPQDGQIARAGADLLAKP